MLESPVNDGEGSPVESRLISISYTELFGVGVNTGSSCAATQSGRIADDWTG
jgi:hypothetical protein